MGSSSSKTKSQSFRIVPDNTAPQEKRPKSWGKMFFIILLIFVMIAIFCVTGITIFYIEETKDTVTNPRITPDIIRICETAQALSMILSLAMFIYFIVLASSK